MSAELLAKTGESVKAGPIWFAVVLVLCIACYFLFKSMSKHLANVRTGFPVDADVVPVAVPTADVDRDRMPDAAGESVQDQGDRGVAKGDVA